MLKVNVDICILGTNIYKKKINDIISDEELTLIVKFTEEFSFAQLNEIYNSVALQWHYEQQVNVHEICNQLKVDNQKSKKASWDSNVETKVGFNF